MSIRADCVETHVAPDQRASTMAVSKLVAGVLASPRSLLFGGCGANSSPTRSGKLRTAPKRPFLLRISAVVAGLCLLGAGCTASEPISVEEDVNVSPTDAESDAGQGDNPDGDVDGPDASQGSVGPAAITELRYEKIIHHVQGPENRVEVVWSDDGMLTITRPPFMTHPGTHTVELSFDLDEEWGLSDTVGELPDSSEDLAARTHQRMKEDRIWISDPETSVVKLIGDDPSQEPYSIEAMGVQFWAEAYERDTELAQLAKLEERIWELMNTILAPAEDE